MISFCVVKLPNNLKASKRASSVSEGMLVVKYAVGEVADFILRAFSNGGVSFPNNVILLSFRASVRLMLAVSVIEPDLARSVLVFKKTCFHHDLIIVRKS